MRFAASPLLVAVAFGFLNPTALEAEDDDLEEVIRSDVPAREAASAEEGEANEPNG